MYFFISNVCIEYSVHTRVVFTPYMYKSGILEFLETGALNLVRLEHLNVLSFQLYKLGPHLDANLKVGSLDLLD